MIRYFYGAVIITRVINIKEGFDSYDEIVFNRWYTDMYRKELKSIGMIVGNINNYYSL